MAPGKLRARMDGCDVIVGETLSPGSAPQRPGWAGFGISGNKRTQFNKRPRIATPLCLPHREAMASLMQVISSHPSRAGQTNPYGLKERAKIRKIGRINMQKAHRPAAGVPRPYADRRGMVCRLGVAMVAWRGTPIVCTRDSASAEGFLASALASARSMLIGSEGAVPAPVAVASTVMVSGVSESVGGSVLVPSLARRSAARDEKMPSKNCLDCCAYRLARCDAWCRVSISNSTCPKSAADPVSPLLDARTSFATRNALLNHADAWSDSASMSGGTPGR